MKLIRSPLIRFGMIIALFLAVNTARQAKTRETKGVCDLYSQACQGGIQQGEKMTQSDWLIIGAFQGEVSIFAILESLQEAEAALEELLAGLQAVGWSGLTPVFTILEFNREKA